MTKKLYKMYKIDFCEKKSCHTQKLYGCESKIEKINTMEEPV
jgi:hypothetical protein